MYTLRFDGLFRGFPNAVSMGYQAGFMCYGWLIIKHNRIIARGHGAFARAKDASSNVAEYLALIEGLEALGDLGVTGEAVTICGDAKGIIDQMRGEAAVNSPTMKPLYRRAVRLCRRFLNIQWVWTARKFNKEADSLTRRAMRQIRLDPHNYRAAVRVIDPRYQDRPPTNKFLPLIDLRVYQPLNLSVEIGVRT